MSEKKRKAWAAFWDGTCKAICIDDEFAPDAVKEWAQEGANHILLMDAEEAKAAFLMRHTKGCPRCALN